MKLQWVVREDLSTDFLNVALKYVILTGKC